MSSKLPIGVGTRYSMPYLRSEKRYKALNIS